MYTLAIEDSFTWWMNCVGDFIMGLFAMSSKTCVTVTCNVFILFHTISLSSAYVFERWLILIRVSFIFIIKYFSFVNILLSLKLTHVGNYNFMFSHNYFIEATLIRSANVNINTITTVIRTINRIHSVTRKTDIIVSWSNRFDIVQVINLTILRLHTALVSAEV